MKKILAVDFDGTVVDHRYPDIGPDVPLARETLLELHAADWNLILFTMRSGPDLYDAVTWFATRCIPLFGVNANPEQHTWTQSPKAYAQVYIDDAAFGCPLIEVAGFRRKCVDWEAVRAALLAGPHDAPPLVPRKS